MAKGTAAFLVLGLALLSLSTGRSAAGRHGFDGCYNRCYYDCREGRFDGAPHPPEYCRRNCLYIGCGRRRPVVEAAQPPRALVVGDDHCDRECGDSCRQLFHPDQGKMEACYRPCWLRCKLEAQELM